MDDTARLEFMVKFDCFIIWSTDRKLCCLIQRGNDLNPEDRPVEGRPAKWYDDFRSAIDGAIHADEVRQRAPDLKRFADAEHPTGYTG